MPVTAHKMLVRQTVIPFWSNISESEVPGLGGRVENVD